MMANGVANGDSVDEEFVHISLWYDRYGTDPCSRTERVTLDLPAHDDRVPLSIDVSTGHMVLAYMEDHMNNQGRLDEEWEELQRYEPEIRSTSQSLKHRRKNKSPLALPYDHSRVVLDSNSNIDGSDYINASLVTDHDPRCPAYVATQGPLPHTVADFWQMVWETESVVIVNLAKLVEKGDTMYHQYWPMEGSELYHIYQVHLVSEHSWCSDYVVRSFYLKNLATSETRTVTQFHFLTWPECSLPCSTKALLDFRRKVNKSFRSHSKPIIIHCSDGIGRTGTYCLVDMVLNRLAKGAKELDLAATLEHLLDQRMNMVKRKDQLEFALTAVAEEIQIMLKPKLSKLLSI